MARPGESWVRALALTAPRCGSDPRTGSNLGPPSPWARFRSSGPRRLAQPLGDLCGRRGLSRPERLHREGKGLWLGERRLETIGLGERRPETSSPSGWGAHLRPRRMRTGRRGGRRARGGSAGAGPGWVRNLGVSGAQAQLEQEANHAAVGTLTDCTVEEWAQRAGGSRGSVESYPSIQSCDYDFFVFLRRAETHKLYYRNVQTYAKVQKVARHYGFQVLITYPQPQMATLVALCVLRQASDQVLLCYLK